MRSLLGLPAVFGFCVGCYGVADWIFSYTALSNLPAVVAGPQFIVMTLQALGGFLLLAVCISAIDTSDHLIAITGDKDGSVRPRKTCPDCAEQVLTAARVCRYCRHEFTAAPAASGAPARDWKPAPRAESELAAMDRPQRPIVRPLPDEQAAMDPRSRTRQALHDLQAGKPMLSAGATILVIIAVIAGTIALLAVLNR